MKSKSIFHVRPIFGSSIPISDDWASPSNPSLQPNEKSMSTSCTATALSSTSPLSAPYQQIQIPSYYPHSHSPVHNCSYPSPLHYIYIQPSFFRPDQAAHCYQLVHEYATSSQVFSKGRNTDRHVNYATVDFPLEDCPSLNHYMRNELQFQENLFQMLEQRYNISQDHLSLDDIFVVQYQAKKQTLPQHSYEQDERRIIMDRLEPHRDGTLLAFTIVLTPPSNFKGGGTFFEALRNVSDHRHDKGVIRVQNAGDLVMHSGKLLHGADTVTQGERTVLVGFVQVHDSCVRKNVLGQASRDWGRMDVALRRKIRQEERGSVQSVNTHKEGRMQQRMATVKRVSFLPLYSCIRGITSPHFTTVLHRGDVEYQRKKRLEIEDILLRDALLPWKKRKRRRDTKPSHFFSNDITIL